MKITTLIALRELAVKDLEAATATAEITRANLSAAQVLLDEAEEDVSDEGILAKYREDVRRQRDAHLDAMDRQREAQAVLDDLDAHDWH